jgi:ABC-type ATPase involved in cell division
MAQLTGAQAIIYSTHTEADRALSRDMLIIAEEVDGIGNTIRFATHTVQVVAAGQ